MALLPATICLPFVKNAAWCPKQTGLTSNKHYKLNYTSCFIRQKMQNRISISTHFLWIYGSLRGCSLITSSNFGPFLTPPLPIVIQYQHLAYPHPSPSPQITYLMNQTSRKNLYYKAKNIRSFKPS